MNQVNSVNKSTKTVQQPEPEPVAHNNSQRKHLPYPQLFTLLAEVPSSFGGGNFEVGLLMLRECGARGFLLRQPVEFLARTVNGAVTHGSLDGMAPPREQLPRLMRFDLLDGSSQSSVDALAEMLYTVGCLGFRMAGGGYQTTDWADMLPEQRDAYRAMATLVVAWTGYKLSDVQSIWPNPKGAY